jgi:hypothetical protein
MAQANQSKLDTRVMTFVEEQRDGATANDVVRGVAQAENASEKDVQRALRSALNRGDLEVGERLRLFSNRK